MIKLHEKPGLIPDWELQRAILAISPFVRTHHDPGTSGSHVGQGCQDQPSTNPICLPNVCSCPCQAQIRPSNYAKWRLTTLLGGRWDLVDEPKTSCHTYSQLSSKLYPSRSLLGATMPSWPFICPIKPNKPQSPLKPNDAPVGSSPMH